MLSGVDEIEDTTQLKPTIRPFNRNDLGKVINIERRTFTNPWSRNMYEALYQINPDGFYVAVIDESIVGYGIVLMEQSLRRWSKKRKAHLMNLAVHQRFRNHGIGSFLIATIISDIKRLGATEIYLEVRSSNANATAFYTKLGFKRIGLIKRFYGDEDAIKMGKKISWP